MKAIVGLGNPGPQYVGTRHNAGFDVLDRLAGLNNLTWKGRFSGMFTDMQLDDEKLLLLKPGTYMNLSGRSVLQLVEFYKLQPSAIMVVSDDFNLPIGKMRIREGGSHGGHNGLESIMGVVGEGFCRLRLGIGEPRGDSAQFVLSRFSPIERESFDIVLRYATDAVLEWVKNGTKAAQERFNGLDIASA